MELGDYLSLDHLLFKERKCRSCGKVKNILDDFYLTRKGRKTLSAYSYECKECTIRRVSNARNVERPGYWEYPDW